MSVQHCGCTYSAKIMRQSRKEETAETRFLGSISSSSIRNLLPGSISSKQKSSSNPKIPKSDAENTPPTDPNIQVHDDPSLPTTTKQLPSKTSSSQNEVIESDATQDPSVKASTEFVFLRLSVEHWRSVICKRSDEHVNCKIIGFSY